MIGAIPPLHLEVFGHDTLLPTMDRKVSIYIGFVYLR